jgi:hypothetical protein
MLLETALKIGLLSAWSSSLLVVWGSHAWNAPIYQPCLVVSLTLAICAPAISAWLYKASGAYVKLQKDPSNGLGVLIMCGAPFVIAGGWLFAFLTGVMAWHSFVYFDLAYWKSLFFFLS